MNRIKLVWWKHFIHGDVSIYRLGLVGNNGMQQFGWHLCSTHSPQFRIFCWLVKLVFISSRWPDEWIVSLEDLYPFSGRKDDLPKIIVMEMNGFFSRKNPEVMYNTQINQNRWFVTKRFANEKDNQRIWTLNSQRRWPQNQAFEMCWIQIHIACPVAKAEDCTAEYILYTMGTHNLHFFWAISYNPYFEGLKPSFFMVLGSKGRYMWCLPLWHSFQTMSCSIVSRETRR